MFNARRLAGSAGRLVRLLNGTWTEKIMGGNVGNETKSLASTLRSHNESGKAGRVVR